MPNRQSSNKKWFLIAFSVVGAALIYVAASEDFGEFGQIAGTLAPEESISYELVAGETNFGRMDDTFGVSLNATNQTNDLKEEELTLYFSRDENFDSQEDCKVDQRSFRVDPSEVTPVQFRAKIRLVDCLDAGTWFTAVSTSSGDWIELQTQYRVESGKAEVGISTLAADVTPRGEMELQLNVNRPATTTGYDGLNEFAVDIWLQQGDVLCLFEVEEFAVARDPVAQASKSWGATPVNLTVNLQDAKRVDPSSMASSPFEFIEELETERGCEDCQPLELEAGCRLSEGKLKVVAGPTSAGFHVVHETYHHAAPVVVETGKVQVSVRSGEIMQVTRTAYNPSVKQVSWRSESTENDDWLIGMEDQNLPSRTPSTVGFTVSATDLEPGIYETTVSVVATDFYGTETLLDVEVTVTPSRSVVTDTNPDAELPASFSLGNYPNPFNPSTTIRFELPQREQTSLVVFDVTGRQVRVLHDGELDAGLHEIRFSADDLPSGTYLYRLVTPTATRTEKMILVK